MRVSIANFVSNALEMLRFSTDAALSNAGTDDFDYIVITWNESKGVREYIDGHPRIINVRYCTNDKVGYVANLRGMINLGFDECFKLNDYGGIVNTDMYLGKDWLINLVRYANEKQIVNSTHISPIRGAHVITDNLGVPERASFKIERFHDLYAKCYKDTCEHENERGGWRATNTMPYLFHRKWWKLCGPWALEHISGEEPPDRKFFKRCHDAGLEFTMSGSSIVYHHEAVERKNMNSEA